MVKTPISVALERQIPEHIRADYELFVNFIKAYYEFLEQTQKRDLEDIRSIDNTLDEFVIRFKKELSMVFPTNTVANERFILQKIREFYQARGSKESYQFLFRILFNKDVDVFYPSTQILRASDGKWIQEKSLFVKVGEGSDDLFSLSGKIITLKTTYKHISVFCPRVVYYRDNIYEVFIDRAFTQDISIGDEVVSDNGLSFGTILPCPAKYTITNGGKGFEAGQLFNLQSESGNGSLVKITKIGTGGSIKKIQIITFGLDYESTFYAKLSNKTKAAAAYVHPVPGPYPDATTGYVDFGYINKQDYFLYDQFYTPTVNSNEGVFYADGTYVGEIVGSYYTNAANNVVIDADTAEVKIELGAVAIYPGYYATSDGFISDESFIQDGKYYQLFSYVIKVEQQIDSYIDIVKELLHPAGMEVYAEYAIKNNYLVSATALNAFIRRQYQDQVYTTDDEATNQVYKNVTTDDSVVTAFHSFLNDIKNVQISIQKYTSAGALTGETDQRRWSTVDPVTANLYFDDKYIPATDSTSSTSDFRYNDVYKLSTDANNILDTISNKDVTQLKQDYQTIDSESSIRYWDIASVTNGTFFQVATAVQSNLSDISKTAQDDFVPQVDVFNRTISYDRSIIPLVSLDPAIAGDTYSDNYSASKADSYTIVGGEWSWNGSQYVLINPEVRVGVGYMRTPDMTLIGTVTSGSTVVTLTSGTTDGILNGRELVKASGTGAFGSGTIRVNNILSSTSFDMNIAAVTSGSIVITVIGETAALAQTISPSDTFPDGSTQSLVKFSLSGSSWDKIVPTLDTFVKSTIFDRVFTESNASLDSFPDGSIQGIAKFSFSGSSWTDTLSSPVDSTPVRIWNKAHADSINNINTGTLYYNAYNQNDASDPNSSYSYEAETYSVHDTRAIS